MVDSKSNILRCGPRTGGTELKQAQKFRYMGGILTVYGKCGTEIQSCIWIGKDYLQSLSKVLRKEIFVCSKTRSGLNYSAVVTNYSVAGDGFWVDDGRCLLVVTIGFPHVNINQSVSNFQCKSKVMSSLCRRFAHHNKWKNAWDLYPQIFNVSRREVLSINHPM